MSLKLRLALFNTIFVLAALGLGFFMLSSQTRRVFLESVDRDLFFRGQMITRDRRPNGNGGPGGIPGNFGNPGPNGGPNGGPGPGGPPNDDIGRPVRYGDDRKPINNQETKPLDSVALEAKNDGPPTLTTTIADGVPIRVITLSMAGFDRPSGFIQFGHDLHDFERLKQNQISTILLLVPFSVIIASIVGWFLAGKAVKPINDVATASEKISGSEMSTRLKVKGNDEISRLSSAFNGMVDRLQLSFNERQKLLDELKIALEKQRQFVGDASHELRTPLARIRITTSSALEQESSPAEMKEALEIADRETVKMSNLVDQLLTLARLDSGQTPSLSNVDLSQVAKEVTKTFPTSSAQPVELNIETHANIIGDFDGLVRAVANLLENAHRYSPESKIVVSTHVNGDLCRLVVRDYGDGIEAQHINRLTERFYRVDDARNRKLGGTGLGLAIVKSIVEASGGTLEIRSKPGDGTEIHLIFPCIR